MKQPTPVELLQEKLKELERARDISKWNFERGEITEELFDTHMENLTPMIEEYRYVIRVINQYK
jgi:hypothetical protein